MVEAEIAASTKRWLAPSVRLLDRAEQAEVSFGRNAVRITFPAAPRDEQSTGMWRSFLEGLVGSVRSKLARQGLEGFEVEVLVARRRA